MLRFILKLGEKYLIIVYIVGFYLKNLGSVEFMYYLRRNDVFGNFVL